MVSRETLQAATIVLGISLAATAAGTTPEKVLFSSLDGEGKTQLDGYLYLPSTPADKAPAIVLAHGCGGMLDSKGRIREGTKHWAARFAQQGFVVLAVDSFNPRGHKEVCTQSNRPILESRERPRDAYGALKYLSARADVAKDRIFLMGFSNGATGALYAVEKGGAPLILATEAGVSFRAAMAFYPGCTQTNKRNITPAMPLAIFMGAEDDWTPAAPCRDWLKREKAEGREVAYFEYPGAYHGFDVPGSTVRVRTDVRMSNRPGLASGVHVGGNEEARIAAEKDVDHYLRGFLAPSDAR
jgi:dienelactone hydrolase